MSQDQEDKKHQVMQEIEEVLRNTHDSLKWSWQVVMGFALYNAVQETYIFFKATHIHNLSYDHLLCGLIGLLVFIPTFIRFFYGDNRYLDIHYSELRRSLKDTNKYLEVLDSRLSRGRRLIDVLLLLSHGILFAFLSCSITNHEVFFWCYLALLSTNCFWLGATIAMNRTVSKINTSGTVSKTSKFPERDQTLVFWLINNIIHIIILFVLFLLFYHIIINHILYMMLFVICCFSNSFFDFYYQREFYLPNLAQQFRVAHPDLPHS